MKFFYQSGAMGFSGEGWWWHKVLDYKFPELPVITKTVTYFPKKGRMFPVFPIPFTKSVWNKIGLSNKGLVYWLQKYYDPNLILSIYVSSYEELVHTVFLLKNYRLKGIELNVSCPNVSIDNFYNITYGRCIEVVKKKCNIDKLFLKVRHDQHLSNIENLNLVDRIHINSIPKYYGALSGKLAQKKNWDFIKTWQGKYGIPPVAGCSWTSEDDIKKLKDMGCEYFGIGSVIMTNPRLVERLPLC